MPAFGPQAARNHARTLDKQRQVAARLRAAKGDFPGLIQVRADPRLVLLAHDPANPALHAAVLSVLRQIGLSPTVVHWALEGAKRSFTAGVGFRVDPTGQGRALSSSFLPYWLDRYDAAMIAAAPELVMRGEGDVIQRLQNPLGSYDITPVEPAMADWERGPAGGVHTRLSESPDSIPQIFVDGRIDLAWGVDRATTRLAIALGIDKLREIARKRHVDLHAIYAEVPSRPQSPFFTVDVLESTGFESLVADVPARSRAASTEMIFRPDEGTREAP